MKIRTMTAAAVAATTMAMTVSLFSAEQPAATQERQSEPIYGYRMMSDQERNEYREKMRNARGDKERQALRDEHHKLMEARAKERGMSPPEGRGPHGPGRHGGGDTAGGMNPGGGKGPGSGTGPGSGMGPGTGMGSEAGRGPRTGKGPGSGSGPRGECPAGQECPGPGAGKGPGPRAN